MIEDQANLEPHLQPKAGSQPRRFLLADRVVACIAVAILGTMTSLLFWGALRNSEQTNAKRLTKFAVDVIQADVMEDFGERVKAVVRMSQVWAVGSGSSIAERTSLARAYISQNPGAVSIQFIDRSYRFRELIAVDPVYNDRSLVGRDMKSDSLLGDGLRAAYERRHWGVVPGKFINGKVYDHIIVPVMDKDDFSGFIVLKVDVRQGLADVLGTVSGLGYSLIVRKDGRELYSQGNADRSIADQWGQQVQLQLAGGDWTITALPEPAVLATFKTHLPEVALALGLTVTSLLVLVISFSYVISKRSHQIQDTNAELRKAIDLRRSVEAALRASEARFSGILEMSSDAIVSTDSNQNIRLFNRGAERVFGYIADEVIGQKLDILLPVRFQAQHGQYVKEFGHTPEDERTMSPVRPVVGMRKDGTEFPIEASISKLTLNGERLYTAILRDITERIKAEELLRQLHTELEKRVQERTAELELANKALQDEIAVRTSTEAMLSQLSGRLLQLQDEERRRIARELHDSTAQYLFALTLNISTVQSYALNLPQEAKNTLNDALELLDRCTAEIRTMSYLLHPPILDELGLVPALEWYAAGFTKRSGIGVQLDLPPKDSRIPPEFERTLFRIVQECLSNVHRHSGASSAKISLVANGDEIRMDVSDDGKGFSGISQVGMTDVVALLGVGIAGMRERVRQLGGCLNVSSGERGTIVTTVLAVSKSEAATASDD